MMLLAALSVVSFCLLFFNMGQDPAPPVCWSASVEEKLIAECQTNPNHATLHRGLWEGE